MTVDWKPASEPPDVVEAWQLPGPYWIPCWVVEPGPHRIGSLLAWFDGVNFRDYFEPDDVLEVAWWTPCEIPEPPELETPDGTDFRGPNHKDAR